MILYLTVEELLYIAGRRRQRSGTTRNPTLADKAAALMHSLARDHCLVAGDKRLALAATAVFCEINSSPLAMTNDDAYELTMKVAQGHADVAEIAAALRAAGYGDRPVVTRRGVV